MSQALRNATESLANALYGAPFFFSFSPPLLYLLHIAPSFSLVQGTEPNVIALYRQRHLCSDFSHPVPCALTGPALLMAVMCSLGQTIHGGLFRSLSYSWSCLVYVCVHACVPVIKLLEIPDPFYCSFDPHPWRHEGQSGAPR